MKNKLFFVMLLFAALMTVGCSSSNDDPDPQKPDPEKPDPQKEETNVPVEPGFENLTDAQLDGYVSDFAVRVLFLAIDPDAEYNDIELIDHYLNGLAYISSKNTRGVWGQAKAAVDFALVLKDANALHRSTLIGAMATWGYTSKAIRNEIWKDIQEAKCLPEKYNSYSSDQFWTEFSMGNLDWYAKGVYNAVMAKSKDGISKTGDLAAEMASNRLRHIDLTMAIAPKLVEAGCNVMFAFGDDLISNGKLAYDFVETNGKVLLQINKGNLTGEACLDAVNNNLKLLTKGLEEVVPTSQDLGELLSDLTFEQVKALNSEIEKVIKDAGNRSLTEGAISDFVDNVKGIINPTPWKMNFADQVYEAKDGTCFEVETVEGQAYHFSYYDKYENVLLEGKCAVKETYINVRVDYLDENCDIVPKGTTVGDIVPIPYLGGKEETTPHDIYLWWNSSQHDNKVFFIKTEQLYTHFKFGFTIATKNKDGKTGYTSDRMNFTPDDRITITRQKNVYSIKAERNTEEESLTLVLELEQNGLNYAGRPSFGNIKTLSFYHFMLKEPEIPARGQGDVLDLLSFTIKDHPFRSYSKSTTNIDEYDFWRNNSWTGLKVEDFVFNVKDYMSGEITGETSWEYDATTGGEVSLSAFYAVEDITHYR